MYRNKKEVKTEEVKIIKPTHSRNIVVGLHEPGATSIGEEVVAHHYEIEDLAREVANFDAEALETIQGDIEAIEDELNNLDIKIDQEIQDRQTGDNTLQANIDAEAQSRINGDNTLQGNIDAEVQSRVNGDNTLQANIDAEAVLRASGDQTIINLLNDATAKLETFGANGAVVEGVETDFNLNQRENTYGEDVMTFSVPNLFTPQVDINLATLVGTAATANSSGTQQTIDVFFRRADNNQLIANGTLTVPTAPGAIKFETSGVNLLAGVTYKFTYQAPFYGGTVQFANVMIQIRSGQGNIGQAFEASKVIDDVDTGPDTGIVPRFKQLRVDVDSKVPQTTFDASQAAQDTRLTNLETVDETQNNRLTALETGQITQDTAIQANADAIAAITIPDVSNFITEAELITSTTFVSGQRVEEVDLSLIGGYGQFADGFVVSNVNWNDKVEVEQKSLGDVTFFRGSTNSYGIEFITSGPGLVAQPTTDFNAGTNNNRKEVYLSASSGNLIKRTYDASGNSTIETFVSQAIVNEALLKLCKRLELDEEFINEILIKEEQR